MRSVKKEERPTSKGFIAVCVTLYNSQSQWIVSISKVDYRKVLCG
jgi:hypothetical protein